MSDEFDPEKVAVYLFACCDYEETWHPGITDWGKTDEESRTSGYVSVKDYDRLLALYKSILDLFK